MEPQTTPPMLGNTAPMPISININAGPDSGTSSITSVGTDQHIITDTETTAFNIQDSSLKSAVATFFGMAPDDAFLRSPTPWGLYESFGYPQVQSSLAVQNATIQQFTSSPVTLAAKSFQNLTNATAAFDCGMTKVVTATASSGWGGNSQTPVQIAYSINFVVPDGSGVSPENSMNYTQLVGSSASESENITLGAGSGCSVTLAPGESAHGALVANVGQMNAQIVYQQTLSGTTALNYGSTYHDHHFWFFDINQVMSAAGLVTTILQQESIQITFYTGSKVVLTDANGQLRGSFPAKNGQLKVPGLRSDASAPRLPVQPLQVRLPN
jgi:hypothetical protein